MKNSRLNAESFITPSLKQFGVSNLKGSFGREDVQTISVFYRQKGQMGSFSKLQSHHMCPDTTIYFASRISGAQVCYSKYAKHFD
jgi:hypothetical protein